MATRKSNGPMAPWTEDKLEGPRPAKVLYANSRVAKSCGKAAVLERGDLHATWLVSLVSTPAKQGRE